MTFQNPDTKGRRETFAQALAEDLHTWRCKGDSILPERSKYGTSILYDVLKTIEDAICLCMGYDRLARGLPRARPMFRIQTHIIEDNQTTFFVRWRGFRCEEDEPDEERPPRDIRPLMKLALRKHRTVLRLTIEALPQDPSLSHRSKAFNLPLRFSDSRLQPTLFKMFEFALSVVDDECEQNPNIALRHMIETRSNKTFMCGPCPKCGSSSHKYL